MQATQKIEVIDIKVTKIAPKNEQLDSSTEEEDPTVDHQMRISKLFARRIKKYKQAEKQKMPE